MEGVRKKGGSDEPREPPLVTGLMRSINGFNSRCLHVMTGDHYRETASAPPYDLVLAVRRRHGHGLRMPADTMVRCALMALVSDHDFDHDFTIGELQNSLKHLKNGKAAGLDEVQTEEIKNFGPVTMHWVLSLLNACARTHRLPRLWRQPGVVALLKPGKD